MKALILIGGEGTRLRPLTLNTLKCMVPIVNRRFFEHQFAMLKKYGIKDVILSVCHMPKKIKKIIGSGRKYGVRVKFVEEKKPLGTAGAVKNAEKYLSGTTIVMNGDILSDINIKKMLALHNKNKAVATIALHEVEDPTAYGLVETKKNSRITRFLEKPTWNEIKTKWINAGLYIFDKRVLSYIPAGKNFSLERGVFPHLLSNKENLMAYKSQNYWLDIGKIDKYIQANFDVLEGRFNFPYEFEKSLKWNVKLGKGTKIDKDASLRGPMLIGRKCKIGKGDFNFLTIIGNNCKIGDECSIERSIIWDNVKIGDNVSIKECVIGKGCIIQSNSVLHGAVIGDKTKVTPHSKVGH